MEYFKIDGIKLKNMVINASNNLEKQKEFCNSLNVFPVPDGDTGTNMSMTFKSAVEEIKDCESNSIGEISRLISRGALMGARGNSGVILSQIFRGIAKGLEGYNEVDSIQFAEAIMQGSKYAYKAVMRPTEGTILTIIRSAGEKAVESEEADITKLLEEVCEYSERVLNQTPEMLPALKEAKVVDAGGMGLLIIFKGMYEALLHDLDVDIEDDVKQSNGQFVSVQSTIDPNSIKFGYCTEFFIKAKDATNYQESFKKTITPMGDSIIVIAMDDVIKTHIHTNDPGFVLSEAVKIGEISKIKIDNMREEHREILESEYAAGEVIEEVVEEKEFGFISVVMGTGLKTIFNDIGVDSVIEGGQTMNPSTQDILDRIQSLNARNIFILPNNKNIIMAAEQATKLTDKNVYVIPSKTIPQGITAITAFNGEATAEENLENMKEIISTVKTASVTYAVRDTEMDGRKISEGNILGLVEGKISEIGEEPYEVASDLIESIVDEDTELLTIFYGEDCDEDRVNKMIEIFEEKYEDIDVQSFNGEQPLYYFIISAE
ncbi:DAK2 domain-containing protein [Clostridium sediminicola]|uniref:DAK2 domain-containing protein n=1 Tax=Clostridium sediminicola TaxID=3114879 RepID=UPI0031F24982